MKRRLISKEYIKEAYTQDGNGPNIELELLDRKENLDKLPKEMFHILGDIVSFIENVNKTEGENHENK